MPGLALAGAASALGAAGIIGYVTYIIRRLRALLHQRWSRLMTQKARMTTLAINSPLSSDAELHLPKR